jgi:mobilization protein NikA
MLVTQAEKERITRQAAALGTSASDYVRKAATLLDADDVVALEDIRSLLPEFNAALARIHDNLTAAADHSEKQHREIARMRTPEYRRDVYRSIAEDRIGLDAVASLFGFPSAQ